MTIGGMALAAETAAGGAEGLSISGVILTSKSAGMFDGLGCSARGRQVGGVNRAGKMRELLWARLCTAWTQNDT